DDGALHVEVQEIHDGHPDDEHTREVAREYRAVVEEILELRGDDGRIANFLRSIEEPGALADTTGLAPDVPNEGKLRLLETIDVTGMPEAVDEQARKELRRLERQGEQSPESSMIRSYLDWLIAVPWSKRSEDMLDPNHTREVLDADHAGLEDVKKRITQFVAV